jgi:hypothetical protein
MVDDDIKFNPGTRQSRLGRTGGAALALFVARDIAERTSAVLDVNSRLFGFAAMSYARRGSVVYYIVRFECV